MTVEEIINKFGKEFTFRHLWEVAELFVDCDDPNLAEPAKTFLERRDNFAYMLRVYGFRL